MYRVEADRRMNESEIMQGMIGSIQSVMSLFSMFFAMISGYIVALFLFLHRAPIALRLLAFALLSLGLVFLGGSAVSIQRIQDGLFAGWAKLPNAIIDVEALRNPVQMAGMPAFAASQQQLGVGIGWTVAVLVYLALAYLTFFYRWPADVSTDHRQRTL
jgi:hypothetical protein